MAACLSARRNSNGQPSSEKCTSYLRSVHAQWDLMMRLSDAGLHQRQTKALYPNHRLPPWPNEDAAPRSLEPIVRSLMLKRQSDENKAHRQKEWPKHKPPVLYNDP
jgi:hypothetical protein